MAKSITASPKSLTQTGYIVANHVVTAKHSFLMNPELRAMAFSLQVKNDRKYRCLLNVALTCKAFLEVALDALWEELDSLLPLLKLLPALQVEDNTYVCANGLVFLYDFILHLGSLWECVSKRLG